MEERRGEERRGEESQYSLLSMQAGQWRYLHSIFDRP
jgi:hypothetical protein